MKRFLTMLSADPAVGGNLDPALIALVVVIAALVLSVILVIF